MEFLRFIKRTKRLHSPGFTLIEILLVMALTVILLTVTLQSTVGSAAQINFANSYDKVLDMIRQARSLAISGKAQEDYTNFDGDPATNLLTPAGYGVYFHHVPNGQDSVVLFIDNHALNHQAGFEGVYNSSVSANDYAAGNDIILDTFNLPAGIQFFNFAGEANQNDATLIYKPIFADVIFQPEIPGNIFTFGLQQTGSNVERTHCVQLHKLSGIAENAECS